MKIKIIILLVTGVLCAGILGVASRVRYAKSAAEAERDGLETRAVITGKEIERADARATAADTESSRLQTELDELFAVRKKLSARPPVMALDAHAAAARAAMAQVDWWNMILETKPELQAIYLTSFRGGLPATYGRLWTTLGLSAAQIEQFNDVMIAAAGRALDLKSTARAQGLTGSDSGIATMRQHADAETRRAQIEVLGEAGYRQLQEYENALPVRGLVDRVGGLVAFTDSPLSGAQADQLARILSNNSEPFALAPSSAAGAVYDGRPPDPLTMELDQAMRERRPARQITNVENALIQAREILPPPQLTLFEAELRRRQKVVEIFNQVRQMPDPLIGMRFLRDG